MLSNKWLLQLGQFYTKYGFLATTKHPTHNQTDNNWIALTYGGKFSWEKNFKVGFNQNILQI